MEIPIDDLFAMLNAADLASLMLDDGVHYTPEGYQLLGETVARMIRPMLLA